ncbi:hypothetical protein CTAYLR_003503 [Chrysophaeum taylorii]|uniref:Methyltransferase small domain-containing protein n=1 Tax=Chrysophaeum taylorii TaxID=2483200 RepID=A0AAD7UDT6_9STRA|nr:hypothetical protein CTAYLR_003503 [Chrysophaeum taylorii]
MVCGWRGAELKPEAQWVLDLGSGVGSVGLTALWRLPEAARLVMVEAQEASVRLARKSVEANGLEERVRIVHGDLREFRESGFDLVTGSPPYFRPGNAVASPNSQRAHCRLELRGGVDEYCEAAARCLKPGGVFVFVMAAADTRCEEAPRRAGLDVIERYDFAFKRGRAPHISTIACRLRRRDEVMLPPRRDVVMTLREADGRRSVEYRSWQVLMQQQQVSVAPPDCRRRSHEEIITLVRGFLTWVEYSHHHRIADR